MPNTGVTGAAKAPNAKWGSPARLPWSGNTMTPTKSKFASNLKRKYVQILKIHLRDIMIRTAITTKW